MTSELSGKLMCVYVYVHTYTAEWSEEPGRRLAWRTTGVYVLALVGVVGCMFLQEFFGAEEGCKLSWMLRCVSCGSKFERYS